MAGKKQERIRIQMEAYDHSVLDQSASDIVDTAKLSEKLIGDYGFLFDGSGATGGNSQGSKFSGADSKQNAKADEAKAKGDLNGFLASALNPNQ